MDSTPSHSLPFTRLLHENFSVIITYAFSQPTLSKLLRARFHGEWKYLYKVCFDISEQRANRALLELALQLCLIDDGEKLGEYFKSIKEAKGKSNSHGTVTKKRRHRS